MKIKKVPVRMCLGCQQMKPKKELIRIVKNKEGLIFVDTIGKQPGRGAYICRDVSCFEKARKTKKLERTFEAPVTEELYDTLKQQLGGSDDG